MSATNSLEKNPQALAGLRVLDMGTFIAAPYAAAVLAEFGAEVIKIEKPAEGDPLRKFGTPHLGGDTLCWVSEARNKRSITLDLNSTEGVDMFLELVRGTEVICENFRPGTLEKWNISFETLLKLNPDLIMLSVSGFGQTGPLAKQPGFARIAHAFGGLAHLSGMPGGPPLTPGSTSLADYMTGLYGVVGILIALQARPKFGGQRIDIALYESIFRTLDDLVPAFDLYDIVRDRQGLYTDNACPHGHYQAGDGRWLALACSSDKMFARFADMVEMPELLEPNKFGFVTERLAERGVVNAIVSTWMGDRDSEEVLTACAKFGVPCSLVNTIEDIFSNEQFRARKNLVSRPLTDGRGECTVTNVVPTLSVTPGQVRSLGPGLGEANNEVYGGLLGKSDQEILILSKKGVI